MQTFPCQIFPKSGYKNEQFLIRNHMSWLNFSFEVKKDGIVHRSGTVTGTTHLVLEPLGEAGLYQFSYVFEGEPLTEYFEVKDAIRLGTSVIKAIYVFENSSLLLFVMKDRIKCYDEDNHYFFEENRFSPSDIIQINEDHLLMVSQIGLRDDLTNYALYSVSRSDIIFELKDQWQHLYYNKTLKHLWVVEKSSNRLECYGFAPLNFPNRFELAAYTFDQYKLLDEEKSILLTLGSQLTYIDLKNERKFDVHTHEQFALDLISETAYEHDGLVLKVRDVFTGDTFERIVPGDFNIRQTDFEWAGSNFGPASADGAFDAEQARLLLLYPPDVANPGSYQVVQFPEDIRERTFTSLSYRPVRSGDTLLMIRRSTTRKFSRLIHRKGNLGIWSSEPEITAQTINELLVWTNEEPKQLLMSGADFQPLAKHQDHLLIQNSSDILVLVNGKLVHTYKETDRRDIRVRVFGQRAYVFVSKREECTIYDLGSGYRQVALKVNILNEKHIESHQKIFFYTGQAGDRFMEGFDLLSGQYLALQHKAVWQERCGPGKAFKFEENYYRSCSGILIDPYTLQQKNEVLGDFLSASENLNKVLTKRGEDIYVSYYYLFEKKYLLNPIELPTLEYDEAFLSPDGRYLVLQKETNQYALYDVASNKEINFFSGKFLAFNKDGGMVVEPDKTRAAVVYDPLTLNEITPANYQYYLFKSPDGELYADLSQSVKYYHRIRRCYLSAQEYRQLDAELGNMYTNTSHAAGAPVKKNREQYFIRNQQALKAINVLTPTSVSIETVVRREHYINIGICGTDVKTEVSFPEHLGYYNYSAFSEDNRYFAYVGKPHVRGHICVYQIEYNKTEKTLRLLKKYSSDYPAFASWVCAFSKSNVFATYDSSPDTYLIGVEKLFETTPTDEELKQGNFQIHRGSVFAKYKSWRVIKKKSFVCFSPSGNLMVLSEQGYEPLTLGGYGHSCSCAVHIVSTGNGQIVKSFLDHGAPLEKHSNYKKLTFAAFSEDEKQLMTLSSDGVVLVRNVDAVSKKAYGPNHEPAVANNADNQG